MLIPAWAVYAFLSAIFASLVAIFAKLGFIAQQLDNTIVTTIRAIIMALFLIIFCIATRKTNLFSTFDLKSLVFISISGISGAISWLFYFYAIKSASINKIPAVVAIDKFSVVFVLIFAVLLLGVKPSIYSLLGVIFVSIGAILLSVK